MLIRRSSAAWARNALLSSSRRTMRGLDRFPFSDCFDERAFPIGSSSSQDCIAKGYTVKSEDGSAALRRIACQADDEAPTLRLFFPIEDRQSTGPLESSS